MGETNGLAAAAGLDEVVVEVRRMLRDIRHGSLTLIVQDGRVVQIDATHKLRLTARRTETKT